jgi:hypothetical protein
MAHGANGQSQAANDIVTKGKRREDPVAPPRGERETSANRSHKTCQTSRGTRPTLRMHTREGGDINPFPEGKNTEHKAHRLQDRGKGTSWEDPGARRSGCGGAHGAWRLPQTTTASMHTDEHAPMHYDGGRPTYHKLITSLTATRGLHTRGSTGTTSPLNNPQITPTDLQAVTRHNRAYIDYI